jgi:alkylation response protein AidB-like acyl-CoA dehydrogenase
VRRALAQTHATCRINELLNWQVASRTGDVAVADASATKVFAAERVQRIFRQLEEVVGRHGDATDPETAYLMRWLDAQAKRSLVLTFGGGVNEIQRELIATFGLNLPRVPR